MLHFPFFTLRVFWLVVICSAGCVVFLQPLFPFCFLFYFLNWLQLFFPLLSAGTDGAAAGVAVHADAAALCPAAAAVHAADGAAGRVPPWHDALGLRPALLPKPLRSHGSAGPLGLPRRRCRGRHG